jgi:acetyl-CoA C-acetyltransferase
LQAELDALPKAPFTETPRGAAHIETYTIMYGKHGPEIGIVVGREDETGRRFLSNVSGEPAALIDLQEKEGLIDPEWSHQTAITTSVDRCEPRTPEMR